ncbi:MAG: hypothetical protein ACE5QW_06255 [Thermoplasmata archaeon]
MIERIKIVMTSGQVSEISRPRVMRDRILFYLGIVLVVLGGPVLSLGSFAHDMYNIPLIGEAFHVFGWLNMTFLAVGLFLFALGVVFIALSLRGGLLPSYKSLEEVS